MKCSRCHTEIPNSLNLSFCPVCGTADKLMKPAPSFEKTWAELSEEQLAKNPSARLFDQTWNWYLKDLEHHPEDTLEAFAFLERFGQFTPSLKEIFPAPESFSNLTEAMDPGYRVLLSGVSRLDGQSLYKMAETNPELNDRILEFLDEQAELPETIQPLYLALEGNYAQSREALKHLLHLKDGEHLRLEDPFSIELFTSLKPDEAGRREQLNACRQQKDMQRFLECLYRPLSQGDNPFAHLENPGFLNEKYLSENSKEWEILTTFMLEKDENLRGIHLALQTLKNTFPSLEDICQKLLDLQYQKAYMRPYPEIEQTDLLWD